MEIAVKNLNNEEVGKIEIPERIAGIEIKGHLLHSAVKNQLTLRRRGTVSVKDRGMVRGGGRKPWAQKGTGRARAGTNSSPLWRGGGVIFGPSPKNYNPKLPKKVRRLALRSAFASKVQSGELVVVEEMVPQSHKTKEMVSILKKMELASEKTLIVIHERDENIFRGSRNIPGVKVLLPEGLNVYDLILHKNLLCTRSALSKIQERVQ